MCNYIEYKIDLDFLSFHKECSMCSHLLTCTSKTKNPNYYTNQLTSSINYAKSYKFKTIIDKDLQELYHLDDVYIYNSKQTFYDCFIQACKDFYSK